MTCLEELRRLSAQRASGEFIVATETREVHVYLQQGEVAWATRSDRQRTFFDHLRGVCDLEPEQFTAAVEESRRRQANVGEVLVSRGAVTAEQVRGALWAQMSLGLAGLHGTAGAHHLFLPRGELRTPYTVTFPLDDVLGSPVVPAPHRSNPWPSSLADGRHVLAPAPGAMAGLRWVEAVDDGQPPRDPPGPFTGALRAWHEASIGTGLHHLSVRRPDGLLVGVGLPGGQGSVWGELAQADSQADAVSAFKALTGIRGLPAESPLTLERGVPSESVGPPLLDEATVRDLLAEDNEVLALGVSAPGVGACIAGHPHLDLEALQALLARRTAFHEVVGEASAADPLQSPVASVTDRWGDWVVLPVTQPAHGCLWVLARPELPTGLGFALTRAFARRLWRGG